MTLLGVKWSPISSAADGLVDIVEMAGWDLGRRERCQPCLLHNLDLDFSLAMPGVIDQRWVARCESAIERTQSPWLSLHLGFSAEVVHFRDHMLPVSRVIDREECLRRMIDAVGFAGRHLNVPVLIENLDYCPEGAYEHVCEPAFIREVVDTTGCGLLLDLAHLQVSADWLGYSAEGYAAQLPLDRVIEIHLSSPRRVGQRLDDGHFELVERDFRLLKWLLQRSQPQAVVLEYTRDRAMLAEQLRQIRAVLDQDPGHVGKCNCGDGPRNSA